MTISLYIVFFFQAEDGIRDVAVTGVQTCALPISPERAAFDHCDAGAEVRGFKGSGEPRGATAHDQEVELAAVFCDHRRRLGLFVLPTSSPRLGHGLPPGAFVVSVRTVAPKPVSFVRCAAICAGLTCCGS